MKIKVKPDRFFANWSYVYFKHGWWPFWRSAGWTHNTEVEQKIETLRRHERYL